MHPIVYHCGIRYGFPSRGGYQGSFIRATIAGYLLRAFACGLWWLGLGIVEAFSNASTNAELPKLPWALLPEVGRALIAVVMVGVQPF